MQFYEFGNCYYYNDAKKNTEKPLNAYSEEMHLALWITGNKHPQSWITLEEKTTVFRLKAYVQSILKRLGIKERNIIWGEYADEIFSEALTIHTRSGKKLELLGWYLKK